MDIYTGYDPREAVGWHVFTQSVMEHASTPVSFHPLQRRHSAVPVGSNDFTFSRFLIPQMMGWTGVAIFVDGCDMLCRVDIAELEQLRNPHMAVQVVKHDYETRNPIKYLDTAMECGNPDYQRKNWASVMLINCYHMAWRQVTADRIGKFKPLDLLGLRFIDDDRIGELPIEWNWLADEYGPSADAKLLHWTAGIPAMPRYSDAPHAAEWFAGKSLANAVGSHPRKEGVNGLG
jgi:hypothetical protein